MRLLLWRRSFVAFIHVLYLYAGRHIPGVCVVFFSYGLHGSCDGVRVKG